MYTYLFMIYIYYDLLVILIFMSIFRRLCMRIDCLVPMRLCNIGYASETHLKPKSREISFSHSLNGCYGRTRFCQICFSDRYAILLNPDLQYLVEENITARYIIYFEKINTDSGTGLLMKSGQARV